MPQIYEAIRDKLVQGGMSLKDAKSHAARIYNATHKSAPVGRYSDQGKIARETLVKSMK